MSRTDLSQLWAASTHLVDLASRSAPLPAILEEVARVASTVTGAPSRTEVYVHGVGTTQPDLAAGGSCWSFPILSNTSVLGTLAVYHQQPRPPSRAEIAALRYLVTIASAAIERDRQPPITTRPREPARRPDLPAAGCRTGEGLDSILPFIAADHPESDTPAS